MNQTPRTLNRILLAAVGLLLMSAGALAMALGVPAVARWWRTVAERAGAAIGNLLDATTLPGQRDSWLWIVLTLVMALVVLLLVSWIANQGKGRSGTLAYHDGDDPVPGSVTLNAAVAEQALKAALSERVDLVNSSVATYDFRGKPALRVRVFPRQGVAPYVVAEEVSTLVRALDEVLGVQTPVLISISAGARSRFTRAERVR
ncbi:hypothetical protein GC088_00830 [Arthrobacter sp. JZ12]|uniref:hypothetical protein n=1 Tax=Arthrobacter sp. JZ12 TaxID=2654190 RepID=UPI002B46AE47|nr:hypothetical protein [Arthrobacter sp. JZ12]WRH23808.1 hypothetical protein GC088_00830 [Arthrobacter sp. JZ12]